MQICSKKVNGGSRNGVKWRTLLSKTIKSKQKMPLFKPFVCLACPWRGPFVSSVSGFFFLIWRKSFIFCLC